MSASAAPQTAARQLPGILRDNPRLDRWVRFEAPGRVTVSTGRVEIGQGVLTAMRQIAAEELDISPDRNRSSGHLRVYFATEAVGLRRNAAQSHRRAVY